MLALVGGVPWLVTRAAPAAQGASLSDATRDKILNYIRERFGVPVTTKLSLTSLHPSSVAPGFEEGAIAISEGGKEHSQIVLVSNDAHYLIVVNGSVIDLPQNTPAEMAQRVQEAFKIPANRKISVGNFRHSPSPEFEQGTLTVTAADTPKQEAAVLLARDGKHLIVSEIYNLAVDPRQQALRTISVRDEPSQGPSTAPVTIVEYADLECPTCARVHDFLENQLVPRYGNKVRVVFKEFPLPMHDWSKTAAIACQCAYEINPPSYVPLRSLIFRNQQLINITNLRETLLAYGEQAGVDRVKLAGCIDAQASLGRVQRDLEEGKRLNVDRTPTLFINGKMMIGLPSEDAYYQTVDEILRGGK
jgi:protein-disulfide isomerase